MSKKYDLQITIFSPEGTLNQVGKSIPSNPRIRSEGRPNQQSYQCWRKRKGLCGRGHREEDQG